MEKLENSPKNKLMVIGIVTIIFIVIALIITRKEVKTDKIAASVIAGILGIIAGFITASFVVKPNTLPDTEF